MRVYAFIQVKVWQSRHHVPQFRQPGKPCEENQEGKLSCQHVLAIQMNEKWVVAKCNKLVHFGVQIPNSVTFWKKCQNHALWKHTVPVWNEGSFLPPAVAITAGCEQTGDLNSVHIFKVITTIIIPQIQTQYGIDASCYQTLWKANQKGSYKSSRKTHKYKHFIESVSKILDCRGFGLLQIYCRTPRVQSDQIGWTDPSAQGC